MVAVASGADELANTLLPSLIAGKTFAIPVVTIDSDLFNQPGTGGALYAEVPQLTINDLTTGVVGGEGVFDKLMSSLTKHLKVEFEANRISGAEYTKAYIGAVGAALQAAQQFVLSKDQSYWAALLAQQQVRTSEIMATRARIELETTRVMLSRSQYEAATAEVNYGLVKIKIATEDAAYAAQVAQTSHIDAQRLQTVAQTVGVSYTNTNILPAQLAQIEGQTAGEAAKTLQTEAQTSGITYNNLNLLPAQVAAITYSNVNLLPAQLAQVTAETAHRSAETTGVSYRNANLYPAELAQVQAQTANVTGQTAGITYTNTNILPVQKIGIDRTNTNLASQGIGIDYTNANILPKQASLLGEQVEVQRAQTMNTRVDGATIVAGLVGKQKDLYTQQITSYQRDAETKAVKLYTDAWITQKTIDEGLLAPTQFTNSEVNEMLATLRTNLNMGA